MLITNQPDIPIIEVPDQNGFNTMMERIGFAAQRILEGFISTADALSELNDRIDEISGEILHMSINPSYNMQGLPVNDAIASFRYLTGDIVFMVLYLITVIGCLFTIVTISYKIARILIFIYNEVVIPIWKSFYSKFIQPFIWGAIGGFKV